MRFEMGLKTSHPVLDLVVTVLVVGIIGSVWIERARSDSDGQPNALPIQPGMTLPLPQIQSPDTERRAVVLLDTTCPFSNEGIAFYRRIMEVSASTPRTGVVVLATEDEARIRDWLGVKTRLRIAQVPKPSRLGFYVTPTVLLIDSQGTVTDLLAGRLQAADEERFLQRLHGDGAEYHLNNSPTAAEIDGRQLEALRAENPVVLDVSARDGERDARVTRARWIPAEELRSRAVAELPADRPIVVDCSSILLSACDAVGILLRSRGFDRTFLLVNTLRPRLANALVLEPAGR